MVRRTRIALPVSPLDYKRLIWMAALEDTTVAAVAAGLLADAIEPESSSLEAQIEEMAADNGLTPEVWKQQAIKKYQETRSKKKRAAAGEP